MFSFCLTDLGNDMAPVRVSVLMTYMLGRWSRGLVTLQTFLVLASKQFVVSRTRWLRLVSFSVSFMWLMATNFQFQFEKFFVIWFPWWQHKWQSNLYLADRTESQMNFFESNLWWNNYIFLITWKNRKFISFLMLNREWAESSFEPCG